MADGAKFKVYVEGEREFKAALNDINSALKVNRSELKMLAEQYKITDEPMDNLTTRQKSLGEAMELQGEKSKKIAEQIEKTAEIYGEHDERVKKLVTSYNESEAALAKLQGEYETISKTVNEADEAMKSLSDGQAETDKTTREYSAAVLEATKRLDEIKKANEESLSSFKSSKKTINELDKTYDELTSAIKKQEENVKNLTENLEKAEKAYGESSDETKEYRKQLEEAAKTLDEMTEAAEDNREAVKKIGDEKNSLDGLIDVAQDIAGQFGIEIPKGLNTVIGKIGDFSGLLSTVGVSVAAVGKVISIADDVSESFSQLRDDAQMLGIDTTEYQKLEYALGRVGVSSEGLTEIINPLYSKIKETDEVVGKYVGHMEDLHTASDEEKKKFAELMNVWNDYGIKLYDNAGNLRDVTDIFYDLMEAFAQTTNQTERMTEMQKIFGETASKLNPIVENGGTLLREYGEYAEKTGEILGEHLVNQMDNVNTTLDNFKTKWQNVKDGLGASLISLIGLNFDSTKEYLSYSWSNLKGMFRGYADGTSFAPGGWSVVGEKGPEIIRLPRGSEVFPNGVIPRIDSTSQTNYYNISIRAEDVREFNDIVRIAEKQRQSVRMGFAGR